MMLEDLRLLLSYIGSPDATKSDYLKAIKEDNCLGKRSGKSRNLAASHLEYLYSLDASLAVFRSLHYFGLEILMGNRFWHYYAHMEEILSSE